MPVPSLIIIAVLIGLVVFELVLKPIVLSPITISIGLIGGFVVLGFTEAIWKPAAITFWKVKLWPKMGGWLKKVDPVLPEKMQQMTAVELQAYLTDELVAWTGDSDWATVSIARQVAMKQFERTHSVFINTAKAGPSVTGKADAT